ncbi:MAG: PAS domain S-box protein [Anaerolineales bacterium]
MKFIQEFVKPPIFEDEQKTHQAYLLNIILWTLVFVPIPYLIYVLTSQPAYAFRAWMQTLFGETVNVVLLYIMRRGKVRTASLIQTSAFWLFFTVTAFTASGVQDEAYLFGYPIVILIVGLLLGTRAATLTTALSLISGLGMVYAHNLGWIETQTERPELLTWVISLALFPIIAILQNLTGKTLKDAIIRAQRSEEKYRLISSVSSDYAFESRINDNELGEAIWIAGAFEKMTGYTPEEYIQAGGWYAHIHPDDLEQDMDDMKKLLKNEAVLGSEIRTFAKDGALRWERVFAHPIWDEKENKLVGILGAVQDITERKVADQKLRDSLHQQEAILNNIPDMAWMKDLDSRYIAVNEQFLRISGLRAEEVVGKTDKEIWEPSFAEMYRHDDLEVMQSGVRKTVEELQKDGSGKEYWVETTKTPIRNESGQVIGTTGIARDISERKKTEEAEQRRREMLAKVIDLGKQVTEAGDLNTILDKIWNGVHDQLGFDRLGIFLYDPERYAMNGVIGTDRFGMKIATNVSFDVSKWSTFGLLLEKPNGLYVTENYDVENNIPPENEMYGVKHYAAVAVWAGNKPVAAITVDQLVTQRPILPEQLEALRLFAGYAGLGIENSRLNTALQKELANSQGFIQELENKNTELERFTYTVSHDLKSPLVTITGFLGYLEQDARNGKFENFSRDMHRIRQAVEKMQTLLNDLLELSRIGRIVNDPIEIELDLSSVMR